jgi:hypothetical protein
MDGDIQAQGLLNALTGDFLIADIMLGYHLIDDVPRDHPDDNKYDQSGKQYGGNQGQESFDDISAHGGLQVK